MPLSPTLLRCRSCGKQVQDVQHSLGISGLPRYPTVFPHGFPYLLGSLRPPARRLAELLKRCAVERITSRSVIADVSVPLCGVAMLSALVCWFGTPGGLMAVGTNA